MLDSDPPDGTFTLHFGYYNRNTEQEIDVPVGADITFDLAAFSTLDVDVKVNPAPRGNAR